MVNSISIDIEHRRALQKWTSFVALRSSGRPVQASLSNWVMRSFLLFRAIFSFHIHRRSASPITDSLFTCFPPFFRTSITFRSHSSSLYHNSPPLPLMSTVTISLLPVSLSLVHVARSRVQELSYPILRQLLLPNPTFLNVTCNNIEFSLFAEHDVAQDFETIARQDRERIKQARRTSAASSSKDSAVSLDDLKPIEISKDRWSVLQIDSHSNQIGALYFQMFCGLYRYSSTPPLW